MILDVRTVPEGHSVVTQSTDLSGQKEDLPTLLNTVECRAEIDRQGSAFYILLHFKASFQLECSRCLGPAITPVEGEVRLVAKEEHGKHGVSLDDDSVDFYYDSAHLFIDLSPALYEEIMIALPLQPLYSDSCKGIELPAGKAGSNEANGTKEIDPRWEALRKIKQKN